VRKLASPGLKAKAQQLLTIFQSDPWQNPPPYEKLVGLLSGAYSNSENIVNPVGSFNGTSTIVLFTIELDEHLIGSYFKIL